jgi:transketolase C-terminal domain/subunit
MTAKILTRQSFSRATNYVFKDGRSVVIDSKGIMAADPLSAAASFKVQAMLRPEIKSPVGHICISFHPNDTERMTNDLMVELCEAYMK